MTKRMLIDATHEEETRVAISDGNRLVEYDYESSSRKPIKGNIYLAKVTRVEPSLQAAFVNFGGNRHGFLPFSEIHPDYFRIPISDREALMAEQEEYLRAQEEKEARLERAEAAAAAAEAAEQGESPEEEGGDSGLSEEEDTHGDDVLEIGGAVASLDDEDEEEASARSFAPVEFSQEEDAAFVESSEDDAEETSFDASEGSSEAQEGSEERSSEEEQADAEPRSDEQGRNRRGRGRNGRGRNGRQQFRNKNPEIVGDEEGGDDEQRFRFNLRRKYKIQEVIKRGQIMLVQASKEERGNKGAALGSYLSLPGRYCVLMPNSPRAGGVSRKIANYKDRARMREIMRDLEVPKGMSVIVRTAGVTRTKVEIKRDLDYLLRLWDNIRDLTMKSTAPAIVYEEADLIKRSVRDLYTREIEEIIVSGETGHDIAKNFMKMLIPSHVKKVSLYEETQIPLFSRYQIESQIEEIGLPEVRLRSGGYLVINPTEALVSIDVNSGKATKGRHIEETALKTNLEAADEVARQLRLRDLGGLVVIDFIDMEDRRNNAKVERRLKEALSTDRARVQVGRISSFGLLELSRQRLSPSLTEAQFEKCAHCMGTGLVRTPDAMSITVLRAIEEEGMRARAAEVTVHVATDVALYILNYKRKNLAEIEERYAFEILIRVDNTIAPSDFRVEVSRPLDEGEEGVEGNGEQPQQRVTASAEMPAEDEAEERAERPERGERSPEDGDGRGRSRRRGRRGGRGRKRQDADGNVINNEDGSPSYEGDSAEGEEGQEQPVLSEGSQERSERAPREGGGRGRRPRGRGDRSPRRDDAVSDAAPEQNNISAPEISETVVDGVKAEKPAPRKRKVKISESAATEQAVLSTPPVLKEAVVTVAARPVREIKAEPAAPKEYEVVNQEPKEKKRGWWNKLVE